MAATALVAIGAAAATANTASWTPTANALLLGFAGATAAGTPAKPTISDTGGLTWTEVGDVTTGTVRETLYWARAESSPGSRTATVASTSATSVVLRIVEGADLQIRSISSVPNVGTSSDAETDPEGWLDGAPVPGNVVVAGGMFTGASGVTPWTGFTEFGETAAGTVSVMQTQYSTGWTQIAGSTIDVDFLAQQVAGVANFDAAFTKSGGLGTHTTGLLLTGSIAMTTALQNLIHTTNGWILMEAEGMEGVFGGFIVGQLIRTNGLNGGIIEFRTMAATGSYVGVNFVAPSGGHGSRQRIVYCWDTGAAVGEKAYVSISGSTAVTGDASEPFMTNITHVGSWDGTSDFLATTSYPSPKLLRLAIGETPISRATAATLSAMS